MADLLHIHFENEDPLYSYYITLCHVYYFHDSDDNSDKERLQAEGTIQTLSSLIFHAINIEGTTIREMDNEQYVRVYKRFYNDIIDAIQECCKNDVDFNEFLGILDEIIGAAIKLATAFDKLLCVKENDNKEVEESGELGAESEEAE